jgi:hypothetical protein
MTATVANRPRIHPLMGITGVFAGTVFVASGVATAVATLAAITYTVYLVIIRTSFVEAASTMGMMAAVVAASSTLMYLSLRTSAACLSTRQGK